MKLSEAELRPIFNSVTCYQNREMTLARFTQGVNEALHLIEWKFCPKCGFRWEKKGEVGCYGCGYKKH